jgi:hypothetical protein
MSIYFTGPFYVERDADDCVGIWDAGDHLVAEFNKYTQIPLDDTDALNVEALYWVSTAEKLTSWLNAGYNQEETK